jgi:hypothetical protein
MSSGDLLSPDVGLDHHMGACTATRQASSLEAAVSVMVFMM